MITWMDNSMSSWNVGPEEKLVAFPCDKYPLDENVVLYRGISIQAPASVVYRWLCQLRVAPYSYDRLDNLGRQSPQSLTVGVEKLEVGQRMMGFELVDFQPDQSITLQGKATIYGDGVGSYLIVPLTDSSVRLLAKIRIKYPRGLSGLLLRLFLPLGDMIMMRRQLLNLKKLSERTYHTNSK
jgi:hypothetical protein